MSFGLLWCRRLVWNLSFGICCRVGIIQFPSGTLVCGLGRGVLGFSVCDVRCGLVFVLGALGFDFDCCW